jgi:hypothetical protein
LSAAVVVVVVVIVVVIRVSYVIMLRLVLSKLDRKAQ